MTRVWLAGVVTLTCGCAATHLSAEATMADDETAILALHEQFAAAWSRGDADAVAALFTDDAVRVGVAGDEQHGRDEIRAAMDRVLHQLFPGATVDIDRGEVRLLGPDVAVWRGPIVIRTADGRALKGFDVDVMRREGGRWLILETHPKLYPAPPPG